MPGMKTTALALLVPVFLLAGCKTTGKVVSAPFKGAYAVGKGAVNVTGAVGGAAIDTGKFVGGAAIDTGEFVGKGVYGVGKGIYYVGTVPVKITDAALNTTERMLRMTTQLVDLTGKTVTIAKDIQAVHLNNELAKIKGARNILSVLVDVAR